MIEKLIWNNRLQFSTITNLVADDRSNLIKTLDEYSHKIISFADEVATEEESNRIKGDMFEVLAAVFFERMGDSPSVGLNNYKTISLEEDFGVDGVGINAAGTRVAVQVKFRSNPTELITYTDLAKTFAAGITRHGIDPKADNSIYLFTNSAGANHRAKEILSSRLKVIHRNDIKSCIDNNLIFWKNFTVFIFRTLKN
jgi:hypothetical protein